MNTATLVLLRSTATVDEEVKELPHLNIFDEIKPNTKIKKINKTKK